MVELLRFASTLPSSGYPHLLASRCLGLLGGYCGAWSGQPLRLFCAAVLQALSAVWWSGSLASKALATVIHPPATRGVSHCWKRASLCSGGSSVLGSKIAVLPFDLLAVSLSPSFSRSPPSRMAMSMRCWSVRIGSSCSSPESVKDSFFLVVGVGVICTGDAGASACACACAFEFSAD